MTEPYSAKTKPWHLNPLNLLISQYTTLPYPTSSWAGKTIIVTGSNTGMGLEAARHFSRLGADRLILGVRSVRRGEAARKSILESTRRDPGSIDVWELDLSSHKSVSAFAARASAELNDSGLDVVVGNAGIYFYEFSMADGGDETTIAVNVIGTMLLGILLLPLLRETSARKGTDSVLTFTGSFMHYLTWFPEKKADHIFNELARRETARMSDRYSVSKLIELLVVRELANTVSQSAKPGSVIISYINPGGVVTDLMRNNTSCLFKLGCAFMSTVGLLRPTEVGGRTLVSAAEGGKETHGQYLTDCTIALPSRWVLSEEGGRIQRKLWEELWERLDRIVPGVMGNV